VSRDRRGRNSRCQKARLGHVLHETTPRTSASYFLWSMLMRKREAITMPGKLWDGVPSLRHWYHDNNRLGVHLGVFTGRRFSYEYVENLSKQTYLYECIAAHVPLHALATSLHSQAYSRKNLGTRPASAPIVGTGPTRRPAPVYGRETVAKNNAPIKAGELLACRQMTTRCCDGRQVSPTWLKSP
jgi:hypothetical protein